MHYFKFDIATWIQSTRHLLPEEEGIYLRLVNHYYDTETPFPADLKPVLKRLQLLNHADQVNEVLNDFFTLTDKGWQHNKCNDILKEFHKGAKKNKANGKKGGRPAKAKALSVTQTEPSGFPDITQVEPKHNPNYELRTKNYELETRNEELLTKNDKSLTMNHSSQDKTLVGIKPDDSEFEVIWELYEKKGNRKTSLQKFKRLTKVNLELLRIHLPKYVLATPDKQYRKNFETYLNQESWSDEIPQTGFIKTIEQTQSEAQAQVERVKKSMGFEL